MRNCFYSHTQWWQVSLLPHPPPSICLCLVYYELISFTQGPKIIDIHYSFGYSQCPKFSQQEPLQAGSSTFLTHSHYTLITSWFSLPWSWHQSSPKGSGSFQWVLQTFVFINNFISYNLHTIKFIHLPVGFLTWIFLVVKNWFLC